MVDVTLGDTTFEVTISDTTYDVSISDTVYSISMNSNAITGDLNHLTDVTITSPVNGEGLIYSNGAWINQAGSGTGDMTKAIYDTDSNGIVDTSDALIVHAADSDIHFEQGDISIPASQISDFDTEVSNNVTVVSNSDKYTQAEADTLLDGKVDDSQVLTDVPLNALFTDTDTVYDDTAIQAEVDLNTAKYTTSQVDTLLNAKVDDSQVLTDVPSGAIFTDTIYDDSDIQDEVDLNTAKISYTDATAVGLNTTHRGLTNNPHSVDKTDVGLSNVTNDAQLKSSQLQTTVTDDDTKVPSSGAVVDYVSGLGGGDMVKSTYDTNDNGKVDTSDALITHEADSTNPHSVIASQVNITDSSNNFNATELETAIAEINTKMDKNGYDRYNTDSLPTCTFDYTTRVVSVAVTSGKSNFSFYINNKLSTKTTTQTTTLPDTTGLYYVYFDTSGVLQNVLQSSTPDAAFYSNAITTFVYYNADYPSEYLMNNDEMHGKDMSGITHHNLHSTDGAKYSSGLAIQGLVEDDTTYTASTAGVIFDEDIKHSLATNSTGHATLYRDGTNGAWRRLSADLSVAHKVSGDTYYSYNKWNGTSWEWSEGTSSTDFWIQFFIATPGGVVKMPGQNGYSSVRNARNAIETEVASMNTEGLPNPEFVWLGACIVKRTGEVKLMADGSIYFSLLQGSRGVGTGSGTTSYAADIPTTTTDFNNILSSTDTDVQTALNTIDDISIPTSGVDFDPVGTDNSTDVTVTDSSEIDFTLTGQNITASVKAGSIDEAKLDTSVNTSLDLADSALQSYTETYQGDFKADGSVPMTGTLDLATGTTTKAAIKLTSGSKLTTPEGGVIEFDGTNLFLTI